MFAGGDARTKKATRARRRTRFSSYFVDEPLVPVTLGARSSTDVSSWEGRACVCARAIVGGARVRLVGWGGASLSTGHPCSIRTGRHRAGRWTTPPRPTGTRSRAPTAADPGGLHGADAHVHSSHAPVLTPHCNTSRCPPLTAHVPRGRSTGTRSHAPTATLRCPASAAAWHVYLSHGHPFSRAHWSTSRWPPSPQAHVCSFHGHLFSRAHCSTSRCPPPRRARARPLAPTGTHSHAPTAVHPGGLLRRARARVRVPWAPVLTPTAVHPGGLPPPRPRTCTRPTF